MPLDGIDRKRNPRSDATMHVYQWPRMLITSLVVESSFQKLPVAGRFLKTRPHNGREKKEREKRQ